MFCIHVFLVLFVYVVDCSFPRIRIHVITILQVYGVIQITVFSQKKYEFFERLIIDFDLDETEITREAHRTGKTHAEYSKFGLKPHFLDIFQQQFIGILFHLKENNTYNKEDMISGFTVLLSYIIDCMNTSYAQAISERRLEMHHKQYQEEEEDDF